MSRVHTHYDNLKVARDAPTAVIRAAYKALSQQYHPDKHSSDPTATRIMQLLNSAYDVLSDPEKRQQHDLWILETEGRQSAQDSSAQKRNAPPPQPPTSGANPSNLMRKADSIRNYVGILVITLIVVVGVISHSPKSTRSSSTRSVTTGPNEKLPAQETSFPPVPQLAKPSPPSQDTKPHVDLAQGRVRAVQLNVRSGPGTTHDIIGRLNFLDAVEVNFGEGSGWLSVAHRAGFGYVAESQIEIGTPESTLRTLCVSQSPLSGTVLSDKLEGEHQLKITAPLGDEVLVKLKDLANKTVFKAYVGKGRTEVFRGIPDGTYQAWFASGIDYSEKCGRFLNNMAVLYDPTFQSYSTTRNGAYIYTSVMEYSLRKQQGGNFKATQGSFDDFLRD